MAEDIVAALAAQRKKALLSKAPSWLDRGTCVLHKRNGNIDLYFHCQCKPTTKVQQTIWVGKKVLADSAIATKIAEKLQEKHGMHNHTREAPEAPTAQEQQLRNTVTAQKRKITQVEGQLSQAEVRVAKAADATKATTDRKRQESKAAARRVEIDVTQDAS